jgi:hypothetical protein
MKNDMIEFNLKVENILKYIDLIEAEKKFIRENRLTINQSTQKVGCDYQDYIQKVSTLDKRIINYNAIIISLYSAYESFVESIGLSYLKRLNQIVPSYNELPEKIKVNHIIYSSELILELNKSKYSALDEKKIINNLYNCVNFNSNYKINYESFVKRNTNLWVSTVNDIFSRLGINGICRKIAMTNLFKNYYANKEQIDFGQINSIISQMEQEKLFANINGLIEERNKVAHSWTDNTVNLSIIKDDYISFIKIFCESLYHVLEEQISEYEVMYKGKAINDIIDIYGNRIICFNSNKIKVKKGDKILIKKSEDIYSYGIIESIKHNETDIDIVSNKEAIDIGIKVSTKVKDNYDYYLLIK